MKKDIFLVFLDYVRVRAKLTFVSFFLFLWTFSRLVSSICADVHQDKRSITHTHPFLQGSKKCGCSDEMEKKMVTLLYHRYTNSESFVKFFTGQWFWWKQVSFLYSEGIEHIGLVMEYRKCVKSQNSNNWGQSQIIIIRGTNITRKGFVWWDFWFYFGRQTRKYLVAQK